MAHRQPKEACGAQVLSANSAVVLGKDYSEGRPCGRPKGHSKEGGQIVGGHCYLPQPGDPPTRPYIKRTIGFQKDAELLWWSPNDRYIITARAFRSRQIDSSFSSNPFRAHGPSFNTPCSVRDSRPSVTSSMGPLRRNFWISRTRTIRTSYASNLR